MSFVPFVVPNPVFRVARVAVFAVALFSNMSMARTTGSPYDEVTVAPARTSIYVGSVGLTLTPLERNNGGYRSTYAARVRPYFFASERGTMQITFDDHHQQRLAAGETVTFEGEAINEAGHRRQISGRAEPTDPLSGKIKVRVHVSPRIELVFNTTYRFTGSATPDDAREATEQPSEPAPPDA